MIDVSHVAQKEVLELPIVADLCKEAIHLLQQRGRLRFLILGEESGIVRGLAPARLRRGLIDVGVEAVSRDNHRSDLLAELLAQHARGLSLDLLFGLQLASVSGAFELGVGNRVPDQERQATRHLVVRELMRHLARTGHRHLRRIQFRAHQERRRDEHRIDDGFCDLLGRACWLDVRQRREALYFSLRQWTAEHLATKAADARPQSRSITGSRRELATEGSLHHRCSDLLGRGLVLGPLGAGELAFRIGLEVRRPRAARRRDAKDVAHGRVVLQVRETRDLARYRHAVLASAGGRHVRDVGHWRSIAGSSCARSRAVGAGPGSAGRHLATRSSSRTSGHARRWVNGRVGADGIAVRIDGVHRVDRGPRHHLTAASIAGAGRADQAR